MNMNRENVTIHKDFGALKTRHRELRKSFDESFSIRIHRALSWLERAEKETGDADAAFIFYWISFNANYSIDRASSNRLSEGQQFRDFFNLVTKLDKSNRLYAIVWERFTQEIRGLLNNEYIYANFWQIASSDDANSWREGFERTKDTVNKALVAKNTVVILQILFSRLYTLRNQLVHGNSTWNGAINRQQVRDGFKIISNLQPLFLSIMMENPDENWGELAFPIVNMD
tara:strand:+ start:221 stop:907 length:687 start_codon:yes stop_codon:yes gene_type:complete